MSGGYSFFFFLAFLGGTFCSTIYSRDLFNYFPLFWGYFCSTMFLCSDRSSLLTLYGLWVNLDAAAARSTVETSASSEGGEGSGGGSSKHGGAMGAQWKGVLVKLME
jgi:hypothetical protein